MTEETEKIFGHDWEDIQRAQRGGKLHRSISVIPGADYGSEYIGDGKYRLFPSGLVVDAAERKRRLGRL